MLRCIQGVSALPLEIHRDHRGDLGVLESGAELGFEIKRVFYIKVEAAGAVRSEHANSATEAIVALAGSVVVDLDNGQERQSITLTDAATVLRVDAGVWLRLRDFAPGSVLMVACSETYANTRSYPSPRPDLVFA